MKLFNFCTLGTHEKSHTSSFEWVGTRWVLNDSQKGCKYFLLALLCVFMVGCVSTRDKETQDLLFRAAAENHELTKRVEMLLQKNTELREENYGFKLMFKSAIQESYERHLKNKEK